MKQTIIKKLPDKILMTCILSIMLSATHTFGQQTISGNITDENGKPVIGASIIVKGTLKGTVSDLDGNYAIKAKPSDTLSFSFIGYLTEDVLVGQKKQISISMVPDLVSLDEIVVVGYGTVKKKDLTGAVGQIKGDELEKSHATNINQALQGRMPGVRIADAGGEPGTGVNITIRGVGSTTGSTDPLYVIDGIPLADGSINDFDISNIESIEILKDASAGAIYGSRAANGVVLITTKQGTKGKPVFTFKSYYGWQNVVKKMELLNAHQYRNVYVDFLDSTLNALPQKIRYADSIEYNTDWQDELFRTAPVQNYNLGVTGGTDNFKYNISTDYLKQEDIYLTGYYDRLTLSANLNLKKGIVEYGENLKVSYSNNKNTGGNLWGIFTPPHFPVYDETNDEGGWGTPGEGLELRNPVGDKLSNPSHRIKKRILSNTYAKLNFTDHLSFRLNFGADLSTSNLNEYQKVATLGYNNPLQKSAKQEVWLNSMYNLDALLNYQREFGLHRISLLAGANQTYDDWQRINLSGGNLPGRTTHWFAGNNLDQPSSRLEEHTLQSLFGRAIYTFNDKYILTANFRRDGSSRFAPTNKWGNFPSVSAAWRISQERFMANLSFIDELKLRGGYGLLGFEGVGNYEYTPGIVNTIRYIIGDEIANGHAQIEYGSPSIKWETTATTSLGLDANLFENKVLMVVDLFEKRTSDMLVEVPIPTSTGIMSWFDPTLNVGGVNVKGYEASITYRNTLKNGLYFSVSGNISSAKSKVRTLDRGDDIQKGEKILNANGGTITTEDEEIGAFYGYKMLGIWQFGDTITGANYNEFGADPGDVQYLDVNGDNKINNEDRIIIGSPTPDFIYGITLDLEYKGIDLSMLLEGVKGGQIMNVFKNLYEGMPLAWGYNSSTAVLDRWTEDNPSNEIPGATQNELNHSSSTRWLEDADYLRLKNIQIGYTFPNKLANRVGVQNTRIYVAGRNLLTFSRFSGLDPEVGRSESGAGSQLTQNIYIGDYPSPKSMMVGVQFSF
jgi:TonB-linked SusC/RagA family outer membrane protein